MQQIHRPAGFAMIDTLVALLLFALSLLGACSALIHGMRAMHATVLLVRAVDLAADFTEDLRAGDSPTLIDSGVNALRGRMRVTLPTSGLDSVKLVGKSFPASPEPLVTQWGELSLLWQESTSGTAHELHLPLAIEWPKDSI